jgi:tetratricopeptide (TPR) repeat protein
MARIWIRLVVILGLIGISLLAPPRPSTGSDESDLAEMAANYEKAGNNAGLWEISQKYQQQQQYEQAVIWWIRSEHFTFSLTLEALFDYIHQAPQPKILAAVAIKEFKHQVERVPEVPEIANYAIQALARLYQLLDNEFEMRHYFAAVKKRSAALPIQAEIDFYTAMFYQSEQKIRASQQLLHDIVARYQKNIDVSQINSIVASAHVTLAKMALDAGQYQTARQEFNAVLRQTNFQPIEYSFASYYLGIFAIGDGNLLDATRFFSSAMDHLSYNDHWIIRANLAKCQRYLDILRMYQDKKNSPSYFLAVILLNSILARTGRYPWFLIFLVLPLLLVFVSFLQTVQKGPLLLANYTFWGSSHLPLAPPRRFWIKIFCLPFLNLFFFLVFLVAIYWLGPNIELGILVALVSLLGLIGISLAIFLYHRQRLLQAAQEPGIPGFILGLAGLLGGLGLSVWLGLIGYYCTWDPFRQRLIEILLKNL